jgi:hypothetical protein
MDELRRLEGKSLARAKLRAKRRRVRMIRVRTSVGAIAIFAVAWAIVFGQLVTGNDPVLNAAGRGGSKAVAAVHRRAKAATPEPARQTEVEAEPAPEEIEPEAESPPEEIEVEAAPAEIESEPEPEPAPVITSES